MIHVLLVYSRNIKIKRCVILASDRAFAYAYLATAQRDATVKIYYLLLNITVNPHLLW
jgi:hypothetical protein